MARTVPVTPGQKPTQSLNLGSGLEGGKVFLWAGYGDTYTYDRVQFQKARIQQVLLHQFFMIYVPKPQNSCIIGKIELRCSVVIFFQYVCRPGKLHK